LVSAVVYLSKGKPAIVCLTLFFIDLLLAESVSFIPVIPRTYSPAGISGGYLHSKGGIGSVPNISIFGL
jgi:hypothetical protein